jgi:hypothetical protein
MVTDSEADLKKFFNENTNPNSKLLFKDYIKARNQEIEVMQPMKEGS